MYRIGFCKICRQGVLEILKEPSTGKLYIHCEECELLWTNPTDALTAGPRFRDFELNLEDPEPEDIPADWEYDKI